MKVLKWLKYITFGVIIFFTVVLSAEWVLSRVIVNQNQNGNDVVVYLLSNGAHTDIVMPVKNEWMNWDTVFPFGNTKANDTALTYIGVGWGDKGFYLETPTWADLKFSTAFNAMTGRSSSALHCTYMNPPEEGKRCVKIQIATEQYQKLIQFITQTAQVNQQNLPLLIRTDAIYNDRDAFYEAEGKYTMFQTCNTWTNQALKHAGMKAAVWLAFEKPLINIYKN